MTEDVVRALGHLALGTRFKRIGERLQGQTQRLLEADGITLSVSLFPLLAALDRLGPLSVGEIAEALGVSQPAVTRMLTRLKAEAYVSQGSGADDARLRPVALTRAGANLVRRARASVWARIERAVADACAGLSGPLLNQLAALEQALAAEALPQRDARLAARRKKHASA